MCARWTTEKPEKLRSFKMVYFCIRSTFIIIKLFFCFLFRSSKKKRGKGWAILAYRPIEQVCKKTNICFYGLHHLENLKKKIFRKIRNDSKIEIELEN
jgi:hypothetical protein